MSATVLYRLRNIAKSYCRGDAAVTVLEGFNLDIAAGSFLALMGPSGSGKTTLLNLLAGIDRPERGEIWFDQERLDTKSQRELSAWRSQCIGFVFQAYNLLPMLSAEKNVELPLTLTPLRRRSRQERVQTALELVGLSDCAQRKPSELSGGQQQRVAIARALVSDSQVLLCDEPTGNLDYEASANILETLTMLHEEFDKTIIMVTHDPRAADYTRQIIRLDKGRVAHALAI